MNETLQVDEATPLLPASPSFTERPAVLPAVCRYRSGGLNADGTLDSQYRFPSDAERTAFMLLVQLHFNESHYGALNDSSDIWENWQHARDASSVTEDTGRRASEILNQFLLNHSSSSAIQTIFWTAFPLKDTGYRTTRVIDMLTGDHTPPELLTHPIVEAVVIKYWKYGMKAESARDRSLSLIGHFDALSTPRILHFIDFLGRLVFMGSLIHYLLYPPHFRITLGQSEQGTREIALTFMSAASLARSWSIHTLPAMFVFPAFVMTLPSVPFPGSASFSVLHIALLLQLFLLHLPNSPGLPFAIKPESTIPLSTLLSHGATRIVIPVTLFFFPVLLLAIFLVSASLVDTPLSVLTNSLEVAPMDSRFSFFILFITVIMLLLGGLAVTLAMFPTALSTALTSKWDRYSREIGLHARRSFVEALIQYEPYYFPVPFNVLQLVVRVPCTVFSWFGRPVTPCTKSIEKVVWRASVGLIGAVISGFGLWESSVSRITLMSKRKAETSQRLAKRRRAGVPAFGAETQDDGQVNLAPSLSTASAFSTRFVPSTGAIPNLSVLCARSFVTNLRALHDTRDDWESTLKWLKLMPDNLVPGLFAMLRSFCPQLLTSAMITSYFLRGPSIVLTSDLPGVNKITILATAAVGNSLHELHLTGFVKFADSVFATVLPSMPSLRILVLRGCVKVGSATAEAAARSCPLLLTVNFNYTAVPPVALVKLLKTCSELKVLKLAGIPNWTDATFAKLSSAVFADKSFILRNIQTLKLRQLDLSESSISPFLARCPNLTRLDLSFTHIHRLLPAMLVEARIEKLSLTSTAISSVDVVALISSLPRIKSLALGALGGRQGSSVAIGNTSAMTMTDQTLESLTNVLKDFGQLEKISLVGNTKLGATFRRSEALGYFIRCVGRKCKYLNMSGVHHLQSLDLSGLLPQDDENKPPRLEQLILNNTGVNDDATPYLACCSNLVVLELAGTKISSAGLFSVIDTCPKLQMLNLTSCRSVSVTDRRRFFEAWKHNSEET
ncbi:uncharacterized protein EDB93DRAFT_1337544 [Suillus bovinus]|uniref:uncharacterized protein n=1 Tax=Suillus bovinus TaxID=48563 RepID=UPI001B878771|nr:uncharacterized protein EDB93DRAFT_1337544 [Suillus bovinus]KAG2146556.1 hypothetical protein EDB93DRAFT_1337544 [Suillus bovinus]